MDEWEAAARLFEPVRRRWATPGELARYCEPSTRQTPALDLIDRHVVALLDGDMPRQLLNAPPQTGKSERVSRWTPLWLLTCDPTLRIAIVAADKDLAVRWGRQIRRDLEAHPELGLTLREDSKAAGRWETAQGGGLFCTGIASGTTGRPIDVLLVDDPIKNRPQAESATIRQRAWEFWENDASTRARKALIMSTRWHAADLHGLLAEREPNRWTVLAIPAIAEGPDDPLGRAPGEEMQSANIELHPPGYYYAEQATRSPYVWSSLFQQRPTAAEGNIFKRGDWRFWTYARSEDGRRWLYLRDEELGRDERFDLADCTRFITVDLATSTRTSADFTVAAAWAITLSGDVVLLGRARDRVPEMDHAAFLAPLRERWLTRYDEIYIEESMDTSTLVYALGRTGLTMKPLRARGKGDKLARALPAAGLVRQHRVWLPTDASWLDEWLDEHAEFNKGAHDDQVDVMAYAAQVAIENWLPPEPAEVTEARRMASYADDGFVDLMAAKW